MAILAEMPFYRDFARYGDFEVPFYKRAQITVTAMGLDHVLWYRDRSERYRQSPRRHRTRTIFY